MRVYGYARVSTLEQKTDRQCIALRAAGVSPRRLYTDKQSGKNFDRPRYRQLLKMLQRGDVLMVKSIDRLGRNYREIQEQWRVLTHEMGIDIVVLDMPLLDTRRDKNLMGIFLSDVVLQLLSYVAQTERENMLQRQAEGIAAAHLRGVRFGRPPKDKLSEADFYREMLRWRRDEITIEELERLTELSRSSIYRRMKKLRKSGRDIVYRGRNGRCGRKNLKQTESHKA